WRMSRIHQMQDQLKSLPVQQVVTDIPPPLFSQLFRYLCETESRQVHKVKRIVDPVVIHLLGFSRHITGSCQTFPVGNPVDQRGFSHIGSSCKTDFRKVRTRTCIKRGCAGNELRFLEGHQYISFSSLTASE